jgi:hypothetical protein
MSGQHLLCVADRSGTRAPALSIVARRRRHSSDALVHSKKKKKKAGPMHRVNDARNAFKTTRKNKKK